MQAQQQQAAWAALVGPRDDNPFVEQFELRSVLCTPEHLPGQSLIRPLDNGEIAALPAFI